MEPELSALVETTKKLALLADTLERRSQAAIQTQELSGQTLAQTVETVRRDVSQMVQGSGLRVEQVVKQGLDAALAPGTAAYSQAINTTSAKLVEASRSITETLEATNAHVRRRIWAAYAAVAGAALLLVGGGGLVLWLQWQSYVDLRGRVAAAKIDATTAEAYALVGITSCGGRPCIRLDDKTPRWGSKGEYVLLDLRSNPKSTQTSR